MIPRGTTPTFTLTFDADIDLTAAANVYVTFRSPTALITKTGEDLQVQEKQIDVYLSQAETLQFAEGKIEVQANWTTATGGRVASEIAYYDISRQLLLEVIE